MSPARLRLVLGRELAFHLRRPLIWLLILLLAFLSWGLAGGNVRIQSGESTVGGTKAWMTSQFAVAQMLSVLVFLVYGFFVAVAAGMTVIQDQEKRLGELLHATPLRPWEYVWGKFAGVLLTFLGVLGLHLVLTAASFHLRPGAEAAEVRGPFQVVNYLVPALIFALPVLVFLGGICFAVGERTRRPILVFILPVGLLLGASWLWGWSPAWLDPRWNRLLMLLEPAGLRWLSETYLQVDRGVDFYNKSPIRFDPAFLVSRLAYLLAGLGAVWFSAARMGATLRGSRPARWKKRSRPVLPVATRPGTEPLQLPRGVSRTRPGLVRAVAVVARFEVRELLHSPGLYLFVPLILLLSMGSGLTGVGPLDSRLLLTPGTVAIRILNFLLVSLFLLLLFYGVETQRREVSTGLAPIYSSSAVPTGALLTGKLMATTLVGGLVLLGGLGGCWLAILIQGRVPFDLRPFLLVWGGLILPSILLWNALVAALYAITRSRGATYALGLSALIGTGVRLLLGKATWLLNWPLWNALLWSDMGPLELDRTALLLSRLLALTGAVFLLGVAIRFTPRRATDPIRTWHRLRPRALAAGMAALAPLAIPPLVLGGVLWHQVRTGHQGELADEAGKDYWRRNLATWRDAPLPRLTRVEMDLELDPEQRRLIVDGSYRLENHGAEPLSQIPLTGGGHWEELSWSLDGAPYEPEERSLLYVVTPPEPLAPGDGIEVGFAFRGTFPRGISRRGGELGEFILPAGAVLTCFAPSMAPVLGFHEGIGVDEENRYDPRDYPPGFHQGITKPLFGTGARFSTRFRVTLPAAYRANCVGTLVSDETREGRRTMVWQSDQPVRMFNLVAGRWDVRRGEGVAIYHHPAHTYNLDEIAGALEGARRCYSDWFGPYPWQELKLSEFPGLAYYAQGFPTNITFSEAMGFLTESDQDSNVAFAFTAHEASHQWWGNLLMPGEGPGGNVVAEGLAHFSTILLLEELRGPEAARAFRRRIETGYGDGRRMNDERPLVEVTGERPGDQTLQYDRGSWCLWMLLHQMGREPMLRGLREFVVHYAPGPDYPVLEDLLAFLRPYAPDPETYDACADQWFRGVVAPEFRLQELELEEGTEPGTWELALRVENVGSGRVPVEVAAPRGERELDPESSEKSEEYQEVRTTVVLGPGESEQVRLSCPFRPDRVLVDPDVMVLQLNRELAQVRL